ncbi:DUF1298 domain-containing protein [Nocardia farcinica]|nr:DUF1298 domain-containing protein [Nocardia farcinica]
MAGGPCGLHRLHHATVATRAAGRADRADRRGWRAGDGGGDGGGIGRIPGPVNGPIGRQRRYAVARVRLHDIHRVRAEFGGTVNDIALVAVTAALRAMLIARGERPRPDTIRVLTPVSTRSANARGRLERLFGSDVHDLAPFAPIAMRLRLGIAMLSYRDTLCFGITGDYDSTPDTDLIARTIPAAVTTLLDRARR